MRPGLTYQMRLVSHGNGGDTSAQLNQQDAIPTQVSGASGTQPAPHASIALCCAIPHIKLLFTALYASGKYITQTSFGMTLSFHCTLFVTINSPVLHSHAFKIKEPLFNQFLQYKKQSRLQLFL